MTPNELINKAGISRSIIESVFDEIDASNIIEAEDEETFEDEVATITERCRINIYYMNKLITYLNGLTYDKVKG